MKVVLQRVSRAEVRIGGKSVSSISRGLLLLVGVASDDIEADADRLAEKIARLRIFADDEGKFNRSALDIGGEVLVVPQFTLLADTRKGRRPSFTSAAPPEVGSALVDRFATAFERLGLRVKQGVFGAHMDVELVNEGPVTITLDSSELR